MEEQKEMETSPVPAKPPRLRPEEENTLVSQVLEIIGGIALEALQNLDQPAESDLCLMEEGDDSVFYSDDEQTYQECESDANEGKYSDIQTEGEKKECKELHQSDSTGPGAEADAEKVVIRQQESLQTKCPDAEVIIQTEQNVSSSATAPLQEKEQSVQEAQTSNLEPVDATNEECHTRLNRKEEVPKEMLSVEHQRSSERQITLEQKPELEDNFHCPVGFRQSHSPGYSTLPLLKKSRESTGSREKSFDHLSASKYGSLSYRKIRRGNTQQRIKEFEYMVMNL